jgi:hypothetical protein
MMAHGPFPAWFEIRQATSTALPELAAPQAMGLYLRWMPVVTRPCSIASADRTEVFHSGLCSKNDSAKG